jgi:hypothetical protein
MARNFLPLTLTAKLETMGGMVRSGPDEEERRMLPDNERMELRMPPHLKALVIERAREQGKSLNEVIAEYVCLCNGLDPAEHPVPRKTPGRKPKMKSPPVDTPRQRKRREA